MRIKKSKDLSALDYVWLLYYIIIYTFNCAFNNMQMLSTILLFVICFFSTQYHHSIIHFRKVDKDDCSLWYGIFFLFSSISILWSTRAGIADGNVITTLVQIFVFLLCVDWYLNTKKELDIIIKWFCYACVFFGAVVFFTSPVYTYNSLDFGRFTGMQRNTTGYVLMFGCFFNLYYGKKINKQGYYLASLFCLLVSLLTGSRKIIVGYILALMIWIYFQKDIKKIFQYFIFIVLILAIVVPLLYQIPYIRDTFGSRLLAIFDDSIYDGSVLARERAKQLAVLLFKNKPIIGNGWNSVSSNYAAYWERKTSIYAHNNYLEVAADFGIIGLILFYWKFAKDSMYCFVRARKNAECRFLIICFLVTLVLDYGQVTYCYLYMMSIYAILFKWVSFLRKKDTNEVLEKGI